MTIVNMVGGGGETDASISTYTGNISAGSGYISGTHYREANARYSQYSINNIKLAYTTSDFKVITEGTTSSTVRESIDYLTSVTVNFTPSTTDLNSVLSKIATKQNKSYYTGKATIIIINSSTSSYNNYYASITANYTYDNGTTTFSNVGTPTKPNKVKVYNDVSSTNITGYITSFTLSV